MPSTTKAQQHLIIKPLAEKKVAELPAGDLFWRIENFTTLAQAQAAAVGPIPRVMASQYLLRINEASGSPGSITPVHTHPGSEAFYVLAGEQSIRTPRGVLRVTVDRSEAGSGANTPMQVSSSGATDLHALVMFVVDATKPFSSPAKFR